MSTPEDQTDPVALLSPAVRRLVRQFDLDITGVHGTGPLGRIRVVDVMGLLGGRTDSGNRDAPVRPAAADECAAGDDATPQGDSAEPDAERGTEPRPSAALTTSVFECDLSRVLLHRKKLRGEGLELLTTSYFLTGLVAALDSAPEITGARSPRIGVLLTMPTGELRSALLDAAALSRSTPLDEQVRAVDAALRASLDTDLKTANLLVHHYGESGSVLATPTPIGAGHTASVGIGRVSRTLAVHNVDGVETPRVAARCYVSLSFLADHLPMHVANRAFADTVRVLEQWPE